MRLHAAGGPGADRRQDDARTDRRGAEAGARVEAEVAGAGVTVVGCVEVYFDLIQMTLAAGLVRDQIRPCARRRLGRVGLALRFPAQRLGLLVGLPRQPQP